MFPWDGAGPPDLGPAEVQEPHAAWRSCDRAKPDSVRGQADTRNAASSKLGAVGASSLASLTAPLIESVTRAHLPVWTGEEFVTPGNTDAAQPRGDEAQIAKP